MTADSETWLGFLAKERSLLWALAAPAHPHQGVAEAAGGLRQVLPVVNFKQKGHVPVDGKIAPCGWLKDKDGESWQIVPTVIGKMMQGK